MSVTHDIPIDTPYDLTAPRPFSILVYNERFKQLAEIPLSTADYSERIILVSRIGIVLKRNNSKGKDDTPAKLSTYTLFKVRI